jgi:deoxyadenosine/deoxycytidine kinase
MSEKNKIIIDDTNSSKLSTVLSSELIKIIASIEGNIGVGKSTFVRILKQYIANCEIVDEPVEIWKGLTNPDGQNILGLFYGEIPRLG